MGDSQTGYTSTYHGFYAPLQIALGLVKTLGLDIAAADEMRRNLGLSSRDSKNLVPVDWLAEAILHLMHTPEAIGGIYHLTHPQPARMSDIQRAIIDVLGENVQAANDRTMNLQIHPDLFQEQMAVYESYFQDDPPFDRAQADRYLKSLPCPTMDYTALKELAAVALRSNFGWPKPPPPERPKWQLDVRSGRNGNVRRTDLPLRDADIEFEVLGGVKELALPARRVRFYRRGSSWHLNSVLSSNTTAGAWSLAVTEQSLSAVLSARAALEEMLATGRWSVRGALPEDWLDIVRDCLAHLTIRDVQTTS